MSKKGINILNVHIIQSTYTASCIHIVKVLKRWDKVLKRWDKSRGKDKQKRREREKKWKYRKRRRQKRDRLSNRRRERKTENNREIDRGQIHQLGHHRDSLPFYM